MARVVYGISGEGSGHSSRAREVMGHLVRQGHDVLGVSYDRGYENLADDFEMFETEGLHIASADNKVSIVRTFVENLKKLGGGARKVDELRAVFKQRRPDCVITDFEPMTAYLARRYDLPLVSIDNQHRMRYMRFRCPQGLQKDALLTKTVIRLMVPWPDVALITTFFFGEVTRERALLFPPILRREVLDVEPSSGEHVLAYFTKDFASFVEILRGFPRERFVVYGTGRAGTDGNLRFEGFSREGFLCDLAAARAVVATAGFTLITESLYLGKPYFALPMRGQFEQELNAHLLEDAGYGRNGRRATAETLGDFLYRLPEYRERLGAYRHEGNQAILEKLDELLVDGAAPLRAMQRRAGVGR